MFPISIEWSTPLLEGLALALYVLLAGLVTTDVLLKKSDVPRALGWIGLVWLAPIFGSLLYYLFGINRVTRRALKMRWRNARSGGPGSSRPDCAENIALLCDVSERVTGEQWDWYLQRMGALDGKDWETCAINLDRLRKEHG